MTDDLELKRCVRCGGTTAPAASGRITQWVFACTCGLSRQALSVVETDELNSPTQEVICATCGRRIRKNAPGSFTQWIFQASLCSCAEPVPVQIAISEDNSFDPLKAAQKVQPIDFETAEGIDLDASQFPTDRYKPLLLIDQGTSGTVYCCTDKLLMKRVAIKTLHCVVPESLVSFQQEAKLASRLSHNNIARIFDFGITDGGKPFMVMELISGETLKTKIERTGALTPHDAIHIIYHACLGLAYAHANGVLHRDIKSKNIMVVVSKDESPEAKIIDFGIASEAIIDDQPFATIPKQTGNFVGVPIDNKLSATIVGTPAYMSPDQATGRGFDERSEIYSLGCCLFEALTGETPFSAETALELIQKHAHEAAPTLNAVAPDRSFSEELEKVVKTALSKSPGDRFFSMNQFAAALQMVPEYQSSLGKMTSAELAVPTNSTRNNGSDPVSATSVERNSNKLRIMLIASLASLFCLVILATAYKLIKDLNRTPGMAAKEATTEKHYEDLRSRIGGTGVERGWNSELRKQLHVENGSDLSPETKNINPKRKYSFASSDGRIWLGKGEIRDVDLKEFLGKKVQSLTLVDKEITGVGLSYLADSGLTELICDQIEITDEGLAAISQIRTLRHLVIRQNSKITDRGITKLPKLSRLVSLDLRTTGITDDAIDSIVKCKSIECLDLSKTLVTMKGVRKLVNMPKLSKLLLNDCKIRNDLTGIEELGPKLELLAVGGLKLGDRQLARVAKFPKLSSLDFSQNLITDIGLQYVERIPSLKVFFARDCEFLTDKALKQLAIKRPDIAIQQ